MANGITFIPARDKFAGFGQGFSQGIQTALQRAFQAQQNQQAGQQLSQLFPNLNLQGLTNPMALQGAVQLGLLQQQQQGSLAEKMIGQNQPFTLAPGAGRFTATGQPIVQQPSTRTGSFQQIQDPQTGQQINALIDPVSGNIVKNFGPVEQGLSAKDKIQVAVTQAKEFRADPRIKNLNIIERSERGMEAALKAATSPNVKSRIASDQALGVLFQKMLDPESVVRESEFARTPEGAAAVNRLLAIAPQLKLGGLKLLNEDRQALVNMARKLLNEAKITANKAFGEFETRADTIGLNKKIVFGGVKRFDITEPQQVSLPPEAVSPELEAIQKEIAELEAIK